MNIKKYFPWSIRILLGFFVIIFLGGFQSQQSELDNEINYEVSKFRDIIVTAINNHKDSIDIKRMSEAAYAAMLRTLDPYSNYFTQLQYKNFVDTYSGKYEGIGATVYSINDTISIIAVAKDSPADSAGIKPGDKLLFLDGENVIKSSHVDVAQKLNGPTGSVVSLIVRRGTANLLNEYNLTRRSIPVISITSDFVIPGTTIGYIKSSRFSTKCFDDFHESLMSLKKQKMKSLIIDLRGNQGGYLEEVTKIVDDLIQAGNKITYTKSRNKAYYIEYNSTENKPFEDLPVIVLIDEQSASASEILAGSIQDLDRGLVVGTQSFGKGTVQKYFEFKDGSAFSLTVAEYFIPSGRSIQKPYNQEAAVLDPALKMNMDPNSAKKIESALNNTQYRSHLPVYKSVKGRNLVGGGGIFPDHFEKEDSVTVLTQVMKSKGIFLEYSYYFLYRRNTDFQKKYKDNMIQFIKDFNIDDDILNEFCTLTKSKNIWNEQMYQTDKEYIRNFIKSTIAYTLWGDNGFYAVYYSKDKPVLKAIELIPEAEKMISNK
jgi:carboxyl-terminal processing protease